MSVLRATAHLSLLALVATTRALADTTTAIALAVTGDVTPRS